MEEKAPFYTDPCTHILSNILAVIKVFIALIVVVYIYIVRIIVTVTTVEKSLTRCVGMSIKLRRIRENVMSTI